MTGSPLISFDLPVRLKIAISDAITLTARVESCLLEIVWVLEGADLARKKNLSKEWASEHIKKVREAINRLPGAETDAIWPCLKEMFDERHLIAHGVWMVGDAERPRVVWHSRFLESDDYASGEYFDYAKFDHFIVRGRALLKTFADFKRLLEEALANPTRTLTIQLSGDTIAVCGIDFSGDNAMWSKGCKRSNVWIARGTLSGTNIRLETLSHVGAIEGEGEPFDRLSTILNSGSIAFAAIDAPFSIPADILESNPQRAWAIVDSLTPPDRLFPRGEALVRTFAPQLGDRGQKRLRRTEQYWLARSVNVRSTMWCGPRGGAPFAAACMTLLARHEGPIWPFRAGGGTALIEAFPAAQLRHWDLPYTGYNGKEPSAFARRQMIINGLVRRGLELAGEQNDVCMRSADALDAVICMFAASAVASGRLAQQPGELAGVEGHIAVHL